jgi:hypothetical protein
MATLNCFALAADSRCTDRRSPRSAVPDLGVAASVTLLKHLEKFRAPAIAS